MTEPIDRSLFVSVDPLRLAGSACRQCNTVQFPPRGQCAHCAGNDTITIPLPDRGQIWTWTIQRFAPKPPYEAPPGGFEPYGVGYVDLGAVLVESVLIGDERRLKIGSPVALVSVPVPGDPSQFTFGFAA